MRAIGITGLLVGVVVLGGCSERQGITAPSASAAALPSTAVIADRAYTWSLKCSGDLGFGRLLVVGGGRRVDHRHVSVGLVLSRADIQRERRAPRERGWFQRVRQRHLHDVDVRPRGAVQGTTQG